MLARPLLIRADFAAFRFMVGASSTGNVLLAGSMIVYIHACTHVTLDESLNRAATSPAVNPG
jgi:hypothetical protein